MIRMEKILVPVDFSDASKRAVTYGLSLALQYNARLYLSHIVPSSVSLAYAFPTESFAVEVDQAEMAKKELPLLVPENLRDRVRLQCVVKVGNVQAELLGIVENENVDLMVMGTHGRGGVGRLVLGSVTERMLRRSHVPVLTVGNLDAKREPHSEVPAPLHTILYATDFSEASDAGLVSAVELAIGAKAKLILLHVLNDLNLIYWFSPAMTPSYSAYLQEIRRSGVDKLNAMAASAGHDGVDIRPMMVEGYPVEQILRVAADRNADLIVLNLQGKGFVERALLGATAERVIRMSPVPVLSIPVAAAAGLPHMTVLGPGELARS